MIPNVPALEPLHPPRDLTPKRGQQWRKRSSSKTATNVPKIEVILVSKSGKECEVRALNFRDKYNFNAFGKRWMRTTTLQNGWEPLPAE